MRTFTYAWTKAKREQSRSGPGPYSDPYFALAVLALGDDYTGSEDPKALAERTGWPLEKAREALSCIAEAARRNEEEGSSRHWRPDEVFAERRRAAGHPPH